jgi:hypothetical protein
MDPAWVRYFVACTVLLVLLSLGLVALWAMRRRVLGDDPSPALNGDGASRWVAALGRLRGWAAATDPAMGAAWRTMEPALRRFLDECPPALRGPVTEALAAAAARSDDPLAAARMRVLREELLKCTPKPASRGAE